MAKFKHLILTRFNVRHGPWQRDKSGGEILTDAWMDHRFALFDRFCFPSVRAQTTLDFSWLVFFDPATPEKYRARLERYREFAPFHAEFASDDALIDAAREAAGDTACLVTTRLDNDDAIHRDTIARVQQRLPQDHVTFVNWRNGYYLTRGELVEVEHPSNMFISMIEPRGDAPFRTVWCAEHRNLARHGEIHQITDAPGWIALVHDRNLMNAVQAPTGLGLRSGARRVLERLGLRAPREATADAPRLRPSRRRFADVAPEFGLDPGVTLPTRG